MTVWFTADTHFGHANIIRHSGRPFALVAEMDAALIANWNAVVRPSDPVWHLGDFAFRNERPTASYLQRLAGEKHLIHGNHDKEDARVLKGWTSSQPYAEITIDDTRLVLFHYAMRVWHRVNKGAIHLFGHSHGELAGDRQCCDVGVDNPAWPYRPVSLAEIRQYLSTQPEHEAIDHHRT